MLIETGNPVFGSKTENWFYVIGNWFSKFFHFHHGNYICQIKLIHIFV